MDHPRAVIFDMDGVLVDSIAPHWESWRITCAARGIPIDEVKFRGLFGRSFRAFAEALCETPLDEAQLVAWYDEKEGLYRDIIERRFPLMDGVHELLRELDAAGFRLAIGSSSSRGNVNCVARHLATHCRFHATVSGDEARRAKPDPEVFLRAAEALGVPPDSCAVIEDSVHGLAAARAAKMVAIGLSGTAAAEDLAPLADLVVASLRELNAQGIANLIDARRGCTPRSDNISAEARP